jgi:flagellar motility protein MotE (MotC chaperone)
MEKNVLKKETMALSRNEIVNIAEYIKNVEFNEPISNQFRKLCSENVKEVESYVESLSLPEAFPDVDGINEYNEKQEALNTKFNEQREELNKEFGFESQVDYDSAEESVKTEYNDKLTQLTEAIKAESKAIEEENQSLVDAQKEVNASRDEFMKEVDSIELYVIDVDYVPTYKTPSVNGVNHWTVWEVIDKLTFINE